MTETMIATHTLEAKRPVHSETSFGAAWVELLHRIFVAGTSTEELDLLKLSRLNVAGGNIRNVAFNAAFLAADAGEPGCMKHLLRTARSEYMKLEKLLTESEIGGWA
jgi:hypothetical protein